MLRSSSITAVTRGATVQVQRQARGGGVLAVVRWLCGARAESASCRRRRRRGLGLCGGSGATAVGATPAGAGIGGRARGPASGIFRESLTSQQRAMSEEGKQRNERVITNLTEVEDQDDATRAGVSQRWENIWADGLQPGERFDARKPAPILQHLLDTEALPKGRALVPGCGRGYDPLAFALHGYKTLGIDLAETAVKEAERYVASVSEQPKEGLLELKTTDFFKLEGHFDVIWDYTFLCALHPDARDKWADQMAKLVAPGGELVTLIFPIVEKEGGPPYAMSMSLVKSLLEPRGFRAHTLEMLPDEMCHEGREQRCAIGRWVIEDKQ